MTKILAFVFIFFAAAVSSAAVSSASDELTIGALLPLSGPAAELGTGNRIGAEIAVEELNKAGGINGIPVRLIVEDSRSDPTTAVTAFRKLVDVDHVSFAITTLTSVTMAIRPLAEQKHVLLMAESAHPDLTKDAKYVLRNFITVDLVGEKFVHSVREMKAHRVALMHAEEDWGQAAANHLTLLQKTEGFEIVGKESFQKNASDLRAQILRLLSGKPEIIYVVGYGPAAGLVYRQLAEAHVSVPVVGYLVCGQSDVLKSVKESGLKMDSIDMSLDHQNPVFEKLVELNRAKHSEREVDQEIVTGYDGMRILAEGIRAVGKDSTDVRGFIAGHGKFSGASGEIVFADTGDSRRLLSVNRVTATGCKSR